MDVLKTLIGHRLTTRGAVPVALAIVLALAAQPAGSEPATDPALAAELDRRAAAIEAQMIEWRRHLHQYPELSNREVETAKFIAQRLRDFGLEPQTGIAKTGVVALLEGGRPGPTVALRADMDALPVMEEVDLPFASRVTTEYEGRTVGVMHACGHDTHMAMLLAAAHVLSGMREQLAGRVKFIFQPAEEGAPVGERPAGAALMVQEGVLKDPKVDAIFGLHVFANMPTGHIGYRSGPLMAASDGLEIVVRGRQTHGARPWGGVDPIVVASQIVLGLQTIVSRQLEIIHEPAIVTIGQFDAGLRGNIIPDAARLVGTIRTFDAAMQDQVHALITRTASGIAEAGGAQAEVNILRGNPVTANDPALMARMLPTLERIAPGRSFETPKQTTAEDFSRYQQEVPGLFLFLGVTPPEELDTAASNHSPRFEVDERALSTGVRALVHLTVDYLSGANGTFE